jgi:lysophospholipase L1-like esterase
MMRDLLMTVCSIALLALLPLLYVQGRMVRRRTPKVPEAVGPPSGYVHGGGPPLRLVVLGESTVAGVGAPTHAQALTGQVAVAIARKRRRAVQWLALGRSGISARDALKLLVPELHQTQADWVVLALGVNDVLRFRSPAGWQKDLRGLIDALRQKLGMVPIILAPVPRMQYFPALPQPLRFVLGLRARLLDQAACALAGRLPLVVHVPFRIAPEAKGLYCVDGFHPSVDGYAAWAEQLAAAVPPSASGQPSTNNDQRI